MAQSGTLRPPVGPLFERENPAPEWWPSLRDQSTDWATLESQPEGSESQHETRQAEPKRLATPEQLEYQREHVAAQPNDTPRPVGQTRMSTRPMPEQPAADHPQRPVPSQAAEQTTLRLPAEPATEPGTLPWPDLPDEISKQEGGTAEVWEARLRTWRHLDKLDREQRGDLWSE